MKEKKCTLISFLGMSDIRGINDYATKSIEDVKKESRKGPFMDIFPETERIMPYDDPILGKNSIDNIIIVKEHNKTEKDKESYETALTQIDKWSQEKNISFRIVDFMDDLKRSRNIVTYNDIFETFKNIIADERKKEPLKPILINITSGTPQIGTVAIMLLNDRKHIYAVESKNRKDEGTRLISEKEVKAIKEEFFQSVFSESLGEMRPSSTNTNPKKDIFIQLASSYLTKKPTRTNPKQTPFIAPLLILGETGTGKELLAQDIYHLLVKKTNNNKLPFVTLNCAVIPPDIIATELFGYVKGAFTGADEDKEGVVELADGGILFLDEFGELSLDAQAKLLRVLQDGKFRRVGDNKTKERESFFVLIAATNRDLRKEIKEGDFREDLYFRVAKMIIKLPSLVKKGKEEIKKAGEAYLLKLNNEFSEIKCQIGTVLSDDVISLLMESGLPGNYRQLQTILFNAVIDTIVANGKNENEIILNVETVKLYTESN